jgi:selenocysteine-specific elongation factor
MPHEWHVCKLRLLPNEKIALKSGASVKLHTGTSEVAATVFPLEDAVIRGPGDFLVQLRAAAPIVAAPGDPFILRWPSPVQTIGGGTVIEAVGEKVNRKRPSTIEDLRQRTTAIDVEHRFVEYCVRRAATGSATAAAVSLRTKLLPQRVEQLLAELLEKGVVLVLADGSYAHHQTLSETAAEVEAAVARFHQQSPASPGIAVDDLRSVLPVSKPLLEAAIAHLRQHGRLVERAGRLALAAHVVTMDTGQADVVAKVEAAFRERLFTPPSGDEVAQRMGVKLSDVQQAVRLLREHGRLVAVEDLLFHCEAIQRARELLVAHLTKEGRLESVDFKYLLDTSRKYAIPLLDYFDRTGVTRRSGHTRFLKK